MITGSDVKLKAMSCVCGAHWDIRDKRLGDSCPCPDCDRVYTVTAPEKKSNGSAVNHSDRAQSAAHARQLARGDINSIIECLAPRELRPDLDEPEGMHRITVTVSETLAAQWIQSLERARKLL